MRQNWNIAAVGILMLLTSIPLILKKVPMNQVYGARFGKAFESSKNWYAINAYAGKVLFICGLHWVVAGLLGAYTRLGTLKYYSAVAMAVVALALLASVVATFRYANRL